MIPLLQPIVSNIVVATLIALLAWQVGRSGRRAGLAHVLWITFFVKLITPPIILLPVEVPQSWVPQQWVETIETQPTTAMVAPIQQSASPAAVALESAQPSDLSDAPRHPTQSSAWSHFSFGSLLVILWFVGTVIILLRSLIRFWRFHRLLHREGKLDVESTEFVQQLLDCESMRAGRGAVPRANAPQVLRLPIRVSPMLFGFGRRAVIVCPDRLWESLPTADRHAFLAHESAHFTRRDHWVRWIEWIVTAIYWWFPAVYFARKQLERHEEACCDAWAVSRLETSPRSYAEALLRVVDFISEHQIGIPRLASGMQPTDTLEERLRLLMKPPKSTSSSSLHLAASAACFSLWLVHPVAKVETFVEEVKPSKHSISLIDPTPTLDEPLTSIDPAIEVELPAKPSGFWNQPVSRQWANFSLSLPGAQLVAQADRDITIEIPGRTPLLFQATEMSALAEVKQTNRVIIGNQAGKIRLWDLTAGTPVSLIGQHAAPITSLAYHESDGLVSGDQHGSVMRWDMQSGQVLATWSTNKTTSHAGDNAAVESVRFSKSGDVLAILTGKWNDYGDEQYVHFVNSQTLENISTVSVASGSAIVVDHPTIGWLVVDWAGTVRSLQTNSVVNTIGKEEVSAIVFSHCAALPQQ